MSFDKLRNYIMKIKNLIAEALIITSFCSCSNMSYYQVYKVKSESSNSTNSNDLVFEDENCIIRYNLWAENGNLSFEFYNKTEENIYLNKEKSFFVLNGRAYDYFQNRVYSNNKAVLSSSSVSDSYSNKLIIKTGNRITLSSVFSVSYNESKILCIPSKTTKYVSDFSINSSVYRDCDLFRYPNRKQIKAKSFNSSNSPLVFENRFQYSIGELKEKINFKNNFFVQEIANYPMSHMFEMDYEEYCGDESISKVTRFIDSSSNAFYVKYSKKVSNIEH